MIWDRFPVDYLFSATYPEGIHVDALLGIFDARIDKTYLQWFERLSELSSLAGSPLDLFLSIEVRCPAGVDQSAFCGINALKSFLDRSDAVVSVPPVIHSLLPVGAVAMMDLYFAGADTVADFTESVEVRLGFSYSLRTLVFAPKPDDSDWDWRFDRWVYLWVSAAASRDALEPNTRSQGIR